MTSAMLGSREAIGEHTLQPPADNALCRTPPRLLALSAWSLHVPFGMYLVDLLRPASIVELGTRNGVSYCAFCQAAKFLGLDARCVAIDSWSGDAHTGAYGAAVLADLRKHHDPLYGGFSRLQQSLFHEALAGFEDESIDLLHIDGLHTYEAVRTDFESWLPRMSRRAVVLFHDVAEHRGDFGVWRLWEELRKRYPSFTFLHGHGLGVLGVGEDLPGPVKGLLDRSESDSLPIRSFFLRRGRELRMQTILRAATRRPASIVKALLDAFGSPARGPAAGA